MNCIIPFTKDIKFNTSIGEILSVSLEHDYTVNNSEILGNFIISGEYKSHEVSINKDKFEYVLPFSVDTSTRIDESSIDFSIEDFTYELVGNDILRVKIEYCINAQDLKEEVNENEFDDLLDELEIREEIKEEPIIIEEFLEEKKESINKEETMDSEKEKEKEEILETREIDQETQSTILDNISTEDAFVTYNIHIFSETDTIETVCAKYNTTKNVLEDYNDLSSVLIGDKLIIPCSDE